MTTAAEDLLVDVENHDGLEVYKDNWPVAEELVAAGKITLGPARGPDKAWRRAELLLEADVVTAEERLRHLVAACEADAIVCVVCAHNGVRRDAVTRVLLEGGHDRPSCREHMTYPATVNGVDQVVGLEPVTQPRHVAAARLWAVRS